MNAVEFSSHQHPLNPVDLLPGEDDEEEEDDDDKEESRVCGLCGKSVKGTSYDCSVCNFTAHLGCAKNPPSLVIKESKIHEHTLTLLPRHVSFTCNACGLSGEKSPYVCLSCSFMIHRDCINTPRVIRISRHLQHRLLYTCFLGPGEWDCKVCRKRIDGKYGAYNCASGCSFTVHSRCATRKDVWDGIELEGVPDADEETDEGSSEPFLKTGDNLIRHLCHQHVLRLTENEDIRDAFCYGCSFPVAASNPFYRCQECDFLLHERCANLPREIFTVRHVHPLTLCADDEWSGTLNAVFKCGACHLLSNGFRYRCLVCKDHDRIVEFDVRCSSVAEPLEYHLHPHKLYFTVVTDCICSVCNCLLPGNLSCIECEFHLCFACATLPDKAMYKYDEHPLSHTLGVSGRYWCDICETQMEEDNHLYKCSACGPVLHTECLLGRFRNMRPGLIFIDKDGKKVQLILNDRTSLVRCHQCDKDSHEPLFLMITTTSTDDTTYLCSYCFFSAYRF